MHLRNQKENKTSAQHAVKKHCAKSVIFVVNNNKTTYLWSVQLLREKAQRIFYRYTLAFSGKKTLHHDKTLIKTNK